MIRNKINRFHLFVTEKIWIALLCICTLFILVCLWPNKLNRSLQGYSFMVLDSLRIDRVDNIYFIDGNLKFGGHSVLLPPIITNKKYLQTEVSYKRLLELEEEGKGEWKVISTNPDSISIESTSNPLNGRYAVKILDKANEIGLRYIILDNDSTHLVLRKRIR
ncbi:hypothetical protein Premu_1485 [Hallella multisaccharivorax DSM 17128]|uniref:Uncharacterized protein n=2 Tax=Hallella multisaccharivorax TaxID=310514 RepID=F8NBE4_9BACT|nr:hypothetical protein Premu_1485 [Hallella multisaccharivorax DSM 17128]